MICYEKWIVLTKNEKNGLQLSINQLSIIDQLELFFGNFMVTVLSSVEHAVTGACDLKKNLVSNTTDLRMK